MIISEPVSDPHSDSKSKEFLPDGAVVRIRTDESEVLNLAKAIVTLTDNPSLRNQLAKKIKAVAANHILTWDMRVAKEIALLELVATSQHP